MLFGLVNVGGRPMALPYGQIRYLSLKLEVYADIATDDLLNKYAHQL